MFIPQPGQPLAAMVPVPAAQSAAQLPQGQTMTGKVKAWMEDKGFGFITPDNGGPDVFVHRNQLAGGQSLVAGAQVMFECRLNVTRGKYEATTCAGTGVTAPLDMNAAGLVGVKSGPQDNLWVAGLPSEATEESIRDMLGQYGIVQQCKVLPDTPGKSDRAALVRLADEQQAKWMVENLNGRTLPGLIAPLTVRFAGDRPDSGGGYGKAPGNAIMDNRFAPYGAVAPALQAAAAANPQLSDATLAAALTQLLPGLSQGGQQLQGLQAAHAAVQQLSGQALGGQTLGGQMLGGQQLLGQALAGQPLTSYAVATQPAAAQALTSAAYTGPGFAGQVACGAAAPLQQQLAGQQLVGQQPGVAMAPMAAAALTGPAVAAATAVPAAATAPEAAPAPAGQWLEAIDPASGRAYYYHSVTREVRWDKPAQ